MLDFPFSAEFYYHLVIDSTAQTAPRDLEIINELVSRVTHGFDIPTSP
jgi:hypothetical protein